MDDAVMRVATALRELGASGEVTELPEPVPTAAAAAAQLGCEVGAIANSLVFSADGEPVLIVTSGAHRVDTKRLADRLGARKIKRADPGFVVSATGQAVGGVAPVGHPGPVRTVIDPWLDRYDVVWAGAGGENAMFPTSFDELVKITGGKVAEVGD